MAFCPHEPRLAALADHPPLLELLSRLVEGRPQRVQEMALLKPPGGREKPWHQDHAYFNYPLGTPIAGVWIALDEAGIDNGCMHVLSGGHRQGPVVHFMRRDWQICDRDIAGRPCLAVPLHAGGCMIFDGLLPHGTPPNTTPHRRRALQFHYVPSGTQRTSDAERMSVFGSEGKNVRC
jgi:phytanoyl-CoA hydroxylase